MTGYQIAAASAFWLGVLTTAGPCGLAANVAALLYLAQAAGTPRRTLVAGLFYTLGRMITYAGLGWVISAGLLSQPAASVFLQKYSNMVLGPALILSGMIMAGLLKIDLALLCKPARIFDARGEPAGMAVALLVGAILGLSLCPVGAVQFFSMIGLAINAHSPLLFPMLYGAGTGIPVLVFAVLLTGGLQKAARGSGLMAKLERRARLVTGAVFIVLGVYLCALLMAS